MSPSTAPQPAEVNHPSIGTVRGRREEGVLQFLGIKYASLDHWFDNAKPCIYDGNGIIALQHGPQAISDAQDIDRELEVLQRTLPKPEFPGLSGTDCLTLNISVPEHATPSSALPVLVYIHGGGFTVGSSWWPQYDMNRIVRLSGRIGKPVIGININYRLGAPGFMTSEELRQAGYEANRGLQDQRAALRWVKDYIPGFGGDPTRVTVAGESAGGLSATRLMYTEETLASRIIVLGGSPPFISPLEPSVAESSYKTFTTALGCGDMSSEERVKALQSISISSLQKSLSPDLQFAPITDDALVPYKESFSLMVSDDYIFKANPCEATVIVFSSLDASIFASMGLFAQRQGLAASFVRAAHSSLQDHPGAASRLLQCYDITSELEDHSALLRVLQFGSDIGFQAAALALAESFPGDAFVLEFSELNPWDGRFKGHSTHILDIAFLLQNFNEHLDSTQRAAAEQFAEDIIMFVHGRRPWKPFSRSRGIARLAGGQRRYFEGPGATTERFRELLDIGQLVGLDTALGLWVNFIFGG